MPTTYRYTQPIPGKRAPEPVNSIYAQISRDFLLADGPLMSLSPDPDLLAATWALLRESQVASDAPREITELVAVAVSRANACAFCVDAHTMLLHATGAHSLAESVWHGRTPANADHAAINDWAHMTAHPEREISAPPVPENQARALSGTALVTHFINRITSSLLNESLLPGRLQAASFVRRLGGKTMSRKVRQSIVPGESLHFLEGILVSWEGESTIDHAFAALQVASERGGRLLDAASRETVEQVVASHAVVNDSARTNLETPLQSIKDTDRSGARLAILAAIDPHKITDEDVASWRESHPGDVSLIRLIAWGAMLQVSQIAEKLHVADGQSVSV